MLGSDVVKPARRGPVGFRAFAFAALCGLATVAACIAPTLPIPPPAEPDVSKPDASGNVLVQGGKGSASAGATINVENVTSANSAACKTDPTCYSYVGRPVNDDGSYSVSIPGHSGDELDIWQTVGTSTSGDTQITVP